MTLRLVTDVPIGESWRQADRLTDAPHSHRTWLMPFSREAYP